MKEKICLQIFQRIRNHPDPKKAEIVVMDIIQRITAGETLENIEAIYHEDLNLMKKGAKA